MRPRVDRRGRPVLRKGDVADRLTRLDHELAKGQDHGLEVRLEKGEILCRKAEEKSIAKARLLGVGHAQLPLGARARTKAEA